MTPGKSFTQEQSSPKETKESLTIRVEGNRYDGFTIFSGTTKVGQMDIIFDDRDKTLRIQRIIINPEFKSRGIGRAVLRLIVDQFKPNSLTATHQTEEGKNFFDTVFKEDYPHLIKES